MCLVLIAIRQTPEYPFVLAANRDEFFDRPALPVHEWTDLPGIVGGRDVPSSGSWLAFDPRLRRLALVTNYRSGKPETAARSRGLLVRDQVACDPPAQGRLALLQSLQSSYSGYNLIVGQFPDDLRYYSNRLAGCDDLLPLLQPGVHGLSNAFLNTPWPKVQRGKNQLAHLLASPQDDLPEALFSLLRDSTQAPDAELPDTGIGLEKERWLSSLFIEGETYGTRCSTVLLMDTIGQIRCYERTYSAGQVVGDKILGPW